MEGRTQVLRQPFTKPRTSRLSFVLIGSSLELESDWPDFGDMRVPEPISASGGEGHWPARPGLRAHSTHSVGVRTGTCD